MEACVMRLLARAMLLVSVVFSHGYSQGLSVNPPAPQSGQVIELCVGREFSDVCYEYYGGSVNRSGNTLDATFYFADLHQVSIPRHIRGNSLYGIDP
jgi:hypothetical protein